MATNIFNSTNQRPRMLPSFLSIFFFLVQYFLKYFLFHHFITSIFSICTVRILFHVLVFIVYTHTAMLHTILYLHHH